MARFFNLFFWGLLAFACFNASHCSKVKRAYIDTVSCPLMLTVNTIDIAQSYYKQKIKHKTISFYQASNFEKQWLDSESPRKWYRAFVEEIKESAKYGMNPEEYTIRELESQVNALYKQRKPKEADISRLDIRITAAFFLYTTHLLEGRIRKPGADDFIWRREPPRENDVSLLRNINTSKDLRKEIEHLHPSDPQYSKLQQALEKYSVLQEADDNLPLIPPNTVITPGTCHNAISLIRRKLQPTDMKAERIPSDSLLYDDKLVAAVKQFQKRHGLTIDGMITPDLIKHINIPFRQKKDQIALNLERLRWQPHINTEREVIIINVPEFMLRIYKNKKKTLEMKVILGSEFTATPIFHDTLKSVVFSPSWFVPKSIIATEIIPALKKDPLYYCDRGITIYKDGKKIDPTTEKWDDKFLKLESYRIVQEPGATNPLGNVKFVMPNDMNIYLHDTPTDQLFALEERALSHGCIRLEKPVEFAVYVLKDQHEWNEESIVTAMGSARPQKVDVKETYPVYIVYRTVWVDDNGIVNFREDIYGHDKRQLDQLRVSDTL